MSAQAPAVMSEQDCATAANADRWTLESRDWAEDGVGPVELPFAHLEPSGLATAPESLLTVTEPAVRRFFASPDCYAALAVQLYACLYRLKQVELRWRLRHYQPRPRKRARADEPPPSPQLVVPDLSLSAADIRRIALLVFVYWKTVRLRVKLGGFMDRQSNLMETSPHTDAQVKPLQRIREAVAAVEEHERGQQAASAAAAPGGQAAHAGAGGQGKRAEAESGAAGAARQGEAQSSEETERAAAGGREAERQGEGEGDAAGVQAVIRFLASSASSSCSSSQPALVEAARPSRLISINSQLQDAYMETLWTHGLAFDGNGGADKRADVKASLKVLFLCRLLRELADCISPLLMLDINARFTASFEQQTSGDARQTKELLPYFHRSLQQLTLYRRDLGEAGRIAECLMFGGEVCGNERYGTRPCAFLSLRFSPSPAALGQLEPPVHLNITDVRYASWELLRRHDDEPAILAALDMSRFVDPFAAAEAVADEEEVTRKLVFDALNDAARSGPQLFPDEQHVWNSLRLFLRTHPRPNPSHRGRDERRCC